MNQQDGLCTGPIISGHKFDKKLICIKYPGNVVNVDKAIETLGGISSISMVHDANYTFHIQLYILNYLITYI